MAVPPPPYSALPHRGHETTPLLGPPGTAPRAPNQAHRSSQPSYQQARSSPGEEPCATPSATDCNRSAPVAALVPVAFILVLVVFVMGLIFAHSTRQLTDCRNGVDYSRLATRLDVVQAELVSANLEKKELEVELGSERGAKMICEADKQRMEKEREKKVTMDFVALASRLGTGGDSWICSDTTPSWSFGYVSREPFDAAIRINVWSEALSETHQVHFSSQALPTPDSILQVHIIGYEVISGRIGGNGWWRAKDLKGFGTGEMGFEAQRPFKSSVIYEVRVYYVYVEV